MKHRFSKKAVSLLLVVVLAIGIMPMAVFAAENEIAMIQADEEVTTFRSFESTLAPGIVQTVNSGYGTDGMLINYYIAIADINRDDVGVQASYKNAQCVDLGMSKMTEQAAAMNAKHTNADDEANYIPHYAVVAGINGDGYNTQNGKPSGAHIMNGVSGFGISKAGNTPWFAIFEDGTALCGSNNTDWDAAVAAHGPAQEAIGGFQLVRKAGVDYAPGSAEAKSSYLDNSRYPRSFVGVTADNKVVFMAADGNGAGGSAGTNYAESLEIMDEVGCTYILCLDGGGSATYVSRPEGSNDIQVSNYPSDGSERDVSNGLVIYTSTPPSDVFEKATVTADSYYITPGSITNVSAIGVSPAGTAAEIPENAMWTATLGTVDSDGKFVSDGTTGDAVVSMMVDDKVVGSTTIHVVNPDSVAFNQRAMIVPFEQSVELAVTAMYGLNEVSYKWDDFNISLEDESIGTVSNGIFTAASDGSESMITISLNADSTVTDTISLKLGKGSEVVFDFEEGTASADLNNWQIKDHQGENPVWATTSIVDRSTGLVHNGEQALAFRMPMHTRIHGTEMYAAQSLTWIGDRVELKNALSIGFWVYIPEEATNTEIAVNYIWYDAKGVQKRTTPDACLHDDFNDLENSGWHYMTVPVEKELAYIEDGAEVAAAQGYKRNFFLKFYVTNADAQGESSYFGDIIYYIDDVTIDYSEAVADREAPIFTDVKYAHEGISDAVSLNGQTATDNTISFTAFVNEDTAKDNYSGIDEDSAKTYIDGAEVEFEYSNGVFSVVDADLSNGVHTVTFAISDKNGNYAQISRNITVKADDSEPAVKVVPGDEELETALTGSVYWIDVVAKNVENIKNIELKLDLDTMHVWELEQITKLYGFDVTAEYKTIADKVDNAVTFTLTRTKNAEANGTCVIMSIPVRVWSYCSDETGAVNDPAKAWKGTAITAVSVNITTEKGVVTYIDGSTDLFSAEDICIDTEAYTYYVNMTSTADGNTYWKNNTYHVHNAASISDKSATCTESGYEGRTWCATCASPVEWGTIIPATGHEFEISGGVLKCDCGQTFTGVYTDGKTYTDGIVASGWAGDCYWADGVKLTGVQLVDGYYYNFGDNGVCAGQAKYTGLFYDESVSAYRYAKFGELLGGWVKIGDYWHYFDKTTLTAVTGEYYYSSRGITYIFDETGKTEGTWQKTAEGTRFWYGEWYYTARNEVQRCFVVIDGKTYNFNTAGFLTVGVHPLYDDWASNMNDEMCVYEFDENGALVRQITAPGPIVAHDGMYLIEEDGRVHTRKARAVEFNGDIYFVNHSGRLAKDVNVQITAANGNGILNPGTYYFGEDGKLFVGGIKEDKDGTLYYYKDGQLGTRIYNNELTEIDGEIYLVKWSGKVAKNEFRDITVNNNNGLLAPGKYYFDETGKLYTGTGIVWNVTDQLYYYCVDGVIGSRLYNSELVDVNGDICLVKWSGKVAVNETRDITAEKSNGLLEPGTYYFGDEGTLFTGVKEDADGILYYYKDGQLGNRLYNNQLTEINGAIYFVKWSGKVARDETRIITALNSNGLLASGSYYFGEDGKLFTGMKEDDGILYYYQNGQLGTRIYNSEVVEFNGDIYLIKWSGKVAANETRDITAAKSNGILEPGTYYFGEDGKLQA